LLAAPCARAETFTITSMPAGATVEIDGMVVGTTPYRAIYPDSYFHKSHTIFSTRLDHAMVLRLSKGG
jgi:PEGA domain-containing protein